jgi:hypothetical protein
MGTSAWFADTAQLNITDAAGANPVPVAILQDVEFSLEFEHVELYGMESILRQAVAKHSAKIPVTAKFGAWDPTKDYIMWGCMSGTNATTATVSINDSSQFRNQESLYTLTATIRNWLGTATMTATVYGVYFTGVPFKLAQHEFIMRDLKGTGSNVAYTYAAGSV